MVRNSTRRRGEARRSEGNHRTRFVRRATSADANLHRNAPNKQASQLTRQKSTGNLMQSLTATGSRMTLMWLSMLMLMVTMVETLKHTPALKSRISTKQAKKQSLRTTRRDESPLASTQNACVSHLFSLVLLLLLFLFRCAVDQSIHRAKQKCHLHREYFRREPIPLRSLTEAESHSQLHHRRLSMSAPVKKAVEVVRQQGAKVCFTLFDPAECYLPLHAPLIVHLVQTEVNFNNFETKGE